MLHAVIMAGGAGTRFWPASRADAPKQLLDLVGGRTMLQATLDRLGSLVDAQQTLIVTNRRLVEPIARQLPQLDTRAIVGEPCKRDTAPCIGLAAFWVLRHDPDATMVVMPADHVIQSDQQFQQAIGHAVGLVDLQPQRLVTFGIRPTYPAESFGYIERGEPLPTSEGAPPTFRVARFREKPRADVARQYLEAGNFYWNSGIFVWKAATILEQLAAREPAMHAHLQQIAEAMDTPSFDEVFQCQFEAIDGKSIDFAVMEHADDVAVVEAPFAWDDVGSWQALPRLRGVDESGNTLIGRHLGLNTRGTLVRTDEQHLVVTVGLEDVIVVHTPDATLVANKHDEESIREVVKQLQQRGWTEYL